MKEAEKQAIKKLELFNGLDDGPLEHILDLGQIIELGANSYLCHEGDEIDYFYIVLNGSLDVIKTNRISGEQFKISKVHAGKSIGEVGVAGQQHRTASIKTVEKTSLFRCPIDKLRYLIYHKYKTKHPYLSLVKKVENILNERLQYMNEEQVAAMQEQITYLKEKYKISIFMVSIISILCVYTLAMQALVSLLQKTSDSTYITLPITILLVIVIAKISIMIGFNRTELGITTKNWQRAAYEAILYTLPILVIFTLIKFMIVKFVPHFSHLPVFDMQKNILLILPYLLIIVPVQELFIRGILQDVLAQFLVDKKWTAIIISNLIFSAFHTYISTIFAFVSFFIGLYFGWLYSRNKTLIGPILAHGLMGFWGLCILNILKIM